MGALLAEAPKRPSLPPLLLCGAAFWVGAFASSCLSAGWLTGALAVGVVLCVVCLAALVVLLLKHRRAVYAIVCLFLVLGWLLQAVSLDSLYSQREAWSSQSGGTFMFRVLDDAQEGDYGASATALCWPIGNNPYLPGQSIKVKLFLSEETLTFGSEFQARARFSTPSSSSQASYDKKGVVLGCKLSQVEELEQSRLGFLAQVRNGFAANVAAMEGLDWVSGEGLSVLKALVVGDRQSLFSSSVYQEVKVAGLAHMVAVSGAHLVIVMGMVAQFVHMLRLPKRAAMALQITFLLLYLVMVGFPISCLRAAVMAGLGMVSFSTHRRSYALSSLGLAAIVLIALDPSSANSLSFALSALSTLGIVLFTPLFVAWLPKCEGWKRTAVIEPFCMTFAALLLTFPLSIYSFSQYSVVSPLSNVVAVPLVTGACTLGVAGFVLCSVPVVGGLLLLGAYGFSWLFASTVHVLAALPFAAVPVNMPLAFMVAVSLGIAVALWLVWPVAFPGKALGSGVCVLALLWGIGVFRYANETSVTMLDVGQGDAILFRSEGATLLVDTGNQPKKLLAALARQNVQKLDALVISHPDDDHCGSISSLKGVVSCNQLYVANGIKSLNQKNAQDLMCNASSYVGSQNISELQVGSNLELGSLKLKVVSPAKLEDEGGNQDSVCLLMMSDLNKDGYTEWKGLFAGDAEKEKLQQLEDAHAFNTVDILKVSHHGSKNALTEQLASELDPSLALISVGEGNRYGHPNQITLNILGGTNAQVFRSDQQGDVVCSLRQESIQVTCMR